MPRRWRQHPLGRIPDSWGRHQRRPRAPLDWSAIARREGWLGADGEPGRARRSDTEVAAAFRCARSLVSRKRRELGVPPFAEDHTPPPIEDLTGDPPRPLRLHELKDVAGSRARARRWLSEYVDAGVLVAAGTGRNRRWLLSTTLGQEVDDGE